jgi:hypothetical protein
MTFFPAFRPIHFFRFNVNFKIQLFDARLRKESTFFINLQIPWKEKDVMIGGRCIQVDRKLNVSGYNPSSAVMMWDW